MAAILKGIKFYGCMLATTRGIQSSYLRRDNNGPLFRQHAARMPDFSRCLAIQSAQPQVRNARMAEVSETVSSSSTPTSNVQSLDRALYRIDQDIRRVGRVTRKDVEEVFCDVKEIGGATSTQVLMMIRCCGNLVPDEPPPVRTQLVQEIWGSLEGMGVPLDVSHYNALLRVYIENEHKFSPLEFLSYMEQKGVEPNRVTYQRLITRFCQDGDIDGASKILEFMKQKELPINENVFNALIMGHARANDLESARGILSVMKQAQVEPSADTYTALLKAYAERREIETMKEIFNEVQQKEVEMPDRDYMEVIACLAEAGYEGEFIDEICAKFRKVSGFNQEVMNVCMRLINGGHEDVAKKLLYLMERPVGEDGTPLQMGGFFIRQMIKANRPIEKTLAFIEELEHGNLHNHATFVGLHVALQLGREKEALVLMDKLTEKANENPEMALRSHYFWPLMVSIGKGGRVEDLFDVLKRMSDQKISISLETVSDYVLPYCKNLSPDEMVSRLRASGVGMAMTLNGVTQHLLQRGDVAAAARTATSYGVSYLSWSYLGEDLRNAYLKTEDVESTLTVLACLGDAGGRQGRAARTVVDIPGTFCWHVFTGERKDPQKLEALLEGMASSGFGMSQSSSQKLIDGLGEKLTERISVALEKLSSVDDQQPNLPLLRRRPSAVRDRKAQIDSLESRLANAPTDDTEQRARLLRQILSLEIKEKNVSRVEEVLRRLENEQSVLPVGYLALLIDMYSQTGDVEKAFGLFEEFSKKHPTASMDTSKVLRLANALEAADRYEDAVTLLRNQKPSEATRTQDTSLNHLCWRLLHALAEKKEIGRIREVLDILRDNKIVEINNVLLGPLMKAHLATDDMDKAMETFEEAANIYHCTPWKNELTVKLINREDADRLQKVVDLSTKIHGEVNSLYDLVFCFLETGRTRQARRILETPGLRARNQRFEQICQRFVEEDRVEELENLISITKDIFDVDRGMLFMHLLKVYCKREDTSKALGVWTSLQEEDIQPNPAFLQYLGNYLQSRGQPVPFVIPADKPPVVAAAPKPAQRQQRPAQQQQRPVQQQQTQPLATNDSPAEGVKVSVLRRALRNGDIEGAMKLKEEIENRGEKVPVTDVSHLISSLLGSERLGEAVKMAEGMRAHSQHPLPATFKYLLARLAAAGDFDTVESLGKGLTTDLRKRISYDNHLCSALIHAGKGAEVLTNWEKILSDTGVDGLKSTFPVGGALAMLFNSPEVYPRFEKLAVAAAEGQYLAPMNMMWIWLLTSRDWEKSSCMLDKYLKNAEGLLFRSVLRKIRETNDCELAEELHKQVENCSVTPKSKGVVLSAVLDSHVATGAHDTALEKLDRSLNSKVCTLLDVNYTALERLKLALEATGKAFPYTMPPKKVEKESDAHQDEV